MIDKPLFSGPFTHSKNSVPKVMQMVMLALLPATLFSFYLYNWPAIFLFLTTIAAAIAAEAISLHLAGKPVKVHLMDGSAILTAWLLAMTLPPWSPWWIGVLGAFIAIVIAKQVFGGIGQNLFNPAMVARVALLISFPLEMTLFTEISPMFSENSPSFMDSLWITFSNTLPQQFDSFSGATTLGFVKTELIRGLTISQLEISSYLQQGSGLISGSMGETSAILILLGGLFLIYKRIITWTIPVAMIGSIFILSSLMYLVDAQLYLDPLTHLLSGATLLGAFFIATDLVTSPVSVRGQIIFGVGCGVLTYVIRSWGGYPEGVAFAVILMNACTPLIDHYFRPRIYGRDRKGEPLKYDQEDTGDLS